MESISDQNRQGANALTELATTITFMLGPAASAALVALWSPAVAIAIDAATYAVSAICLSLDPWTHPLRCGAVDFCHHFGCGQQVSAGRPSFPMRSGLACSAVGQGVMVVGGL